MNSMPSYIHCKPGQVEPAYIEGGNGAATMQVCQVKLFELGLTWLGPVQISSLDLLALPLHCSHIQCKLVQLVWVYSVPKNGLMGQFDITL